MTEARAESPRLFDEDDVPVRPPPAKRPDRKTWDRSAIHHWAGESQPLEVQFGERLKEWFTPEEGFEVKWHTNAFHRHDFVIGHRDYAGRTALIELECGKNQPQWIKSILDNRQRWPYGLNVLSRKVAEGQHYDIFIKHNVAGTSFFACTYDLAKTGRVVTLPRHSLQFKTDDVVYSLPWSLVEQPSPVPHPQFCADDVPQLKAMVIRVLQAPQ